MQNRSVTLVCGGSGTGKTSFALRYLVNTNATRFIFDADGEFSGRLGLRAGETVAALNLQLGYAWILFDPSHLFPGQTAEALAFFADWTWAVAEKLPGRKILVVDELYRYSDSYRIPVELSTILENGRKRGVEFLTMCHRPNAVHGVVMNQLTEIVAFQLIDTNALDRLTAVGMNTDGIAGLARGQWLAQNLQSGGRQTGKLF